MQTIDLGTISIGGEDLGAPKQMCIRDRFCTVLLRFKTRGARGRHQWQPEQEAQLPEHPPLSLIHI